MHKQKDEFSFQNQKLSKEIKDQMDKLQRAEGGLASKKNKLKTSKPDFTMDSLPGIDIQLEAEKLKNATFLNALR